jgi:hypothetical protein
VIATKLSSQRDYNVPRRAGFRVTEVIKLHVMQVQFPYGFRGLSEKRKRASLADIGCPPAIESKKLPVALANHLKLSMLWSHITPPRLSPKR